MNQSLSNPLILVAEDDPDDALMLKDAFIENNYSSPTFLSNGKLLMDYIKLMLVNNQIPGLVMLDLNMPVQDGKSVIIELRANPKTQHIPVVVLSTTKNKEDIQSIYNLGANAFFTKPSSFVDLVKITESITNKWLNTN